MGAQCNAGSRHFYTSNVERDNLILSAIGPTDKQALVDGLDPVFANFGHLACSNFTGNWVVGSNDIEIDRADSAAPSNVVAHELGHVLLGGGHAGQSQNLMKKAPANGHSLTQNQCGQARILARDFASRFWNYNASLGRVPAQNPHTPSYVYGEDPALESMEYSCCELNGNRAWTQASFCWLGGGEILPDSKCTVCCQIAQSPPDAAYRPWGECPEPNVIYEKWCEKVCCQIDTQLEFTSKLECENTPGAFVTSYNSCHIP